MKHPISEQMDSDMNLGTITEHAKAVGMLCMYWSTLEYVVGIAVEKLLNSDEKTTSILLSTSRDISQKCEISRRLAHHAVTDESLMDWRHYYLGVLDAIQNVLAPKRNRYVHDDWSISEEKIFQFNRTIKLNKPKARAPKELLFYSKSQTNPDDIWELTETVIKTFMCLSLMSEQLRLFRKFGHIPTIPQPAIEVCKLNPQWRSPNGSEEI